MTIEFLGCALQPPTPYDFGTVLDDVPLANNPATLVRLHEDWRARAEAQLADRVRTGALRIWIPVQLPTQTILPIFGGDPASDWDGLVSSILKMASLQGDDVRVVDFTNVVADRLHQRLGSYPGVYVRSELGPGGTLDPFAGISDATAAIDLLTDVFRADDDRHGRNASAKVAHLLGFVVADLNHQRRFTLARVKAAVDMALHGHHSAGPGVLEPSEEHAILNGSHNRFQQHQSLFDQLFELSALLAPVVAFTPSAPPFRSSGNAPLGRISVQGVSDRAGSASREIAHDLLAARSASDLRSGDPKTTTVILGADDIPERLLNRLGAAVSARGGQLLIVFHRLTDETSARLGWAGGTAAGFMRLANNQDAARAADYLGRQHSFVLAGLSQTSGVSFESGWSLTNTRGIDRSTGRSWAIGLNFSSSTTSAVSRSSSTSHAQSGGKSSSQSTATSHERVYEHLVEPAVFQGLGDGALLLCDVAQRSARLVSCSRDVLRSKIVDWQHFVQIGDGS